MWLYDSNIIIYAAAPANQYLRDLLDARRGFYSLVTRVETLGFQHLTAPDRVFIESQLSQLKLLPVTDEVAERAIRLRQYRKLKLGDALIAATAFEFGLTLVTANTKDFTGLPGILLENPVTPVGSAPASAP